MFGFLDEIYSMSGLSMDVLKGAFRLINLNNKCIYLEGVMRVISVTADVINVRLKKSNLVVKGSDLNIKNMTGDTLMIVGDISSMECVA